MRFPAIRSSHAVILIVVLLAAGVVVFNRRYFFHTELFEYGDLAANSLDVLRAKRFECWLGAYSRWGFHHPGPALFYCLAAGETLWWQWLGLTPTPFNAQTLTVLLLHTFFLGAGLAAAARRVRSAFFAPLALGAATLHLLSVHLDTCLMSSWPPFVMPIPFFCLLAAAASVASGAGGDLPLLALAGCFIIHSHVAHPLFVLPLFGLAYGGLGLSCCHGLRPWRRFPRAHQISAVVCAVFLIPILADLSRGADSNLALVLKHLRTHHGERHPWVDAVSYFLRFGAYRPPTAVSGETWPAVGRYVRGHPQMFGLWLGACLAPLAAWRLRHGQTPARRGEAAGAGGAGPEAAEGRWRFIAWLGAGVALATGLTLFWAHIQDGPMYFYNAVFNYGIYLALAIMGAAAGSDLLEALTARLPGRRGVWAGAAALACAALVGISVRQHPERLLATQGDGPEPHQLGRTVLAALAARPDAPRIKYLGIPDETALEAAPGVAVLLQRRGDDFRVAPKWKTMLGTGQALPEPLPASLLAAQRQAPLDYWHLTPAAVAPEAAARRPLLNGYALETECAAVDPAQNDAIVLAGAGYNGSRFQLQGFAPPAPGLEYTLTTAKAAIVDFRPAPVSAEAEVEIGVSYVNCFGDLGKHPAQRLRINWNGWKCAEFTARLDSPMPVVQARIPAARWNAAAPLALLALEFPDAIRPGEIDPANQDPREIGFTIRRITFRLVAARAGAER